MGFTKLSAPVTSPDGDNGEFCEDDSTTNGCCDFLRALDTQTDMAIEIANSNECLESRTLSGTGLLLNGHDLHDLVFKFWEEGVDDLVLLDRKREEVDFFHRFDLSILHETAKFCDGNPLISTDENVGTIQIQGGERTIPSPRPFDRHDGRVPVPFHGHHDPYQIHRVHVQSQPFCYELKPDQYDAHPNEVLAIRPQKS